MAWKTMKNWLWKYIGRHLRCARACGADWEKLYGFFVFAFGVIFIICICFDFIKLSYFNLYVFFIILFVILWRIIFFPFEWSKVDMFLRRMRGGVRELIFGQINFDEKKPMSNLIFYWNFRVCLNIVCNFNKTSWSHKSSTFWKGKSFIAFTFLLQCHEVISVKKNIKFYLIILHIIWSLVGRYLEKIKNQNNKNS